MLSLCERTWSSAFAHAVRARSHALGELDELPRRSWRIHSAIRSAEDRSARLPTINEALARADVPDRTFPTDPYEGLVRVLSAHGRHDLAA